MNYIVIDNDVVKLELHTLEKYEKTVRNIEFVMNKDVEDVQFGQSYGRLKSVFVICNDSIHQFDVEYLDDIADIAVILE